MNKQNGKFYIGDKVFCLINGNGVVIDKYIYGVKCKFDNKEVTYTNEGKYYVELPIQTIYHGQDLNIIVKETEYEYKIAYIYLGCINISKRLVVGYP